MRNYASHCAREETIFKSILPSGVIKGSGIPWKVNKKVSSSRFLSYMHLSASTQFKGITLNDLVV